VLFFFHSTITVSLDSGSWLFEDCVSLGCNQVSSWAYRFSLHTDSVWRLLFVDSVCILIQPGLQWGVHSTISVWRMLFVEICPGILIPLFLTLLFWRKTYALYMLYMIWLSFVLDIWWFNVSCNMWLDVSVVCRYGSRIIVTFF
jgi:hypothetical protein